jgi:hypothetical protein
MPVLEQLRKSLRLVLPALLAGVMLCASPARAQFGMNMGLGMEGDSITKRGVEAYAKILGLSKDQHDIAMTLLEGNQTELHAAQAKAQEGIKAIREKLADTQDFSLWQKEMPKITKEFNEKKKALDKSFFDDLKAACNDQQLTSWAKVERYHRRETAMRIAFLSGSTVDLTKVVERVKAKPESEIQPLLDQYELDMDKNLQAFEKVAKQAEEDALKGDANMFDMSRAENILKPFYEVAKDMRELNQEYARKLAQVMDDASRAKFEAEVKVRSFPRVYRQPHVVKMLDAAAEFKDLDKAQTENIAGLKAAYTRDAASANDKWAKAVEDREDKAGGTFAAMMKSVQAMQGGGGASDLNKDVNGARTARKELDSRTEKQLLALLSDDQRAKLPEAPREDTNPWADFMPQADEE